MLDQKNILVVDDEEDLREILIDMLEDLDYNIVEASNGKDALDIIKKQDFDWIITDL
jgi:CheY-like chemotaxis protein